MFWFAGFGPGGVICSNGDGGGGLDLRCLVDALGFEGGDLAATEDANKMVAA